jgi:hypothetical protein
MTKDVDSIPIYDLYLVGGDVLCLFGGAVLYMIIVFLVEYFKNVRFLTGVFSGY